MQSPGGGGDKRRSLPPPFGGAAARRASPTNPPPNEPVAPAPPPPAPPPPVAATPAPVVIAAAQPAPAPAPAPMPAPAPKPAPAPRAAEPHGPSTASSLPLRAPVEAAPRAPTDDAAYVIERPTYDFIRISLRRAFTKRIDPTSVLPAERAAMTLGSPPIVDRNFQAFLAWRRSVLFVVACALVPLVILRALDVFGASGTPPAVRGLLAVPVAIEAGFCGLCWWLLGHWSSWHRQRRLLAGGFLIAFGAPFLVYLVPVRAVVSGDAGVAAGLAFSVQAILVLAPRAIATMPGMIRGAMVTKLLLPATAAPGWLMLLAAPLYGLLAYLALVQPYQLTGSGFFVATILSLGVAAFVVGRAGWQLARAQSAPEATAIVARSRNANLIAMGLAGAFALLALADLVDQLHLGALSVVTTVASFAIHVLLLTLVTTDGILAALDRARGRNGGAAADHDRQLASFVAAADSRTLPEP